MTGEIHFFRVANADEGWSIYAGEDVSILPLSGKDPPEHGITMTRAQAYELHRLLSDALKATPMYDAARIVGAP